MAFTIDYYREKIYIALFIMFRVYQSNYMFLIFAEHGIVQQTEEFTHEQGRFGKETTNIDKYRSQHYA